MKYIITFSRVYEIEAPDEETAKDIAYEEFDEDMLLGAAVANEDGFSVKIKEIKI